MFAVKKLTLMGFNIAKKISFNIAVGGLHGITFAMIETRILKF